MHSSTQELNGLMEFEHVIKVEGGVATDKFDPSDKGGRLWAPECIHEGFSGEQRHIEPGQGWVLLEGYSGQGYPRGSYMGPVMHVSEYIGGRMEQDILAQDGYYVALVCSVMADDPDADEDDEPAGWCVAYRPLDLGS
jgi:hypothetical protein